MWTIFNRPVRSVYLIGICGTAMASLAGLLKELGLPVSGSDAGVYPPMSDFLASLEIPVRQGYFPANLQPAPDLVVVGNAIGRGNPELEHALAEGIPYVSMPELIRHFFLPGRRPIVVTGTHGKTTTTSLIAWGLSRLGAAPSFLVGGLPLNFRRNYQLGPGPDFVIEGDEYDTAYFDKGPKFFHYHPRLLVINGIEYDHADIYPDLETIVLQFSRLVNMVPSNGLLAYFGECPRAAEVARQARCPVQSFGLAGHMDWQAVDLCPGEDHTRFRVRLRGRDMGELEIPLAGRHNVQNALAACAVWHHLGHPWEGIRAAMATFLGVERRLTLRGEIGGVRIYDDFAHHPTAIRLTLEGMRQRYPARRIWAIFEPRSWTCRRNAHQHQMEKCFDAADGVILADVFQKEQLPERLRFQPGLAVEAMRGRGREAYFLPSTGQIVEFMAERLKPGDVVVIMSNGGFDDIHHQLLERMRPNHEP